MYSVICTVHVHVVVSYTHWLTVVTTVIGEECNFINLTGFLISGAKQEQKTFINTQQDDQSLYPGCTLYIHFVKFFYPNLIQ